jgi:hypothetical protein
MHLSVMSNIRIHHHVLQTEALEVKGSDASRDSHDHGAVDKNTVGRAVRLRSTGGGAGAGAAGRALAGVVGGHSSEGGQERRGSVGDGLGGRSSRKRKAGDGGGIRECKTVLGILRGVEALTVKLGRVEDTEA